MIVVEEAIQEAQRDGRFSNLPGSGQPLHLDSSPDAIVNNLLKEAKVRPEWIEIGCQIEALEERTARHLAQFAHEYAKSWADLTASPQITTSESLWQRWWRIFWHGSDNRLREGDGITKFNRHWRVAIARYAALLHATNAQIRRFNRLVPQRELQRNVLNVRELLEDFARRYPQTAPHSNEGIAPLRAPVPPHLFVDGEEMEHLPCFVRQQQILERVRK